MTEDQKAKIRWLNRAFHAEKAAKAWLAKLERDRSLAERLSRGSGCPGGNPSGNGTEDALIRLAETERETQGKLRDLVRIREEITQVIRCVEDTDEQTILVWHYLAYQTFDCIAEKMHYSERTVRRKHLKALTHIVLECPVEVC